MLPTKSRISATAFSTMLARALAFSAAVHAQTTPAPSGGTPQQVAPGSTQGEEIAKDPAVRESQSPEITPLGRNEPNLHTGGSDPGLQKAIDDSHNGTTGTTRPQGGRNNGDQPEGQRDGTAPRPTTPAP